MIVVKYRATGWHSWHVMQKGLPTKEKCIEAIKHDMTFCKAKEGYKYLICAEGAYLREYFDDNEQRINSFGKVMWIKNIRTKKSKITIDK